MSTLPIIALVGNAPQDKYEILNSMLAEEDLTDLCTITLYGADGQPEQEALQDAVADYRKGEVQGIVCLPMQTSLRKAIAHTSDCDTTKLVQITINDKCRLASVKGMVSISEAAESLKQEDIKEKAELLAQALKRDLYILNPRIAVMSLNSEIATNETSEEINIIAPAVSELVKNGIQAFGPIACGTFFNSNDYTAYDAVLEMYDQQCINDFKSLSDYETYTIASGIDIPLVQTAAESLFQAIFTLIDMIRNRKEYDAPFANPLQKLYHERKEGGDKSRFTVKKKGYNPAEHRRENITYITKKDLLKTDATDNGNKGNLSQEQGSIATETQKGDE